MWYHSFHMPICPLVLCYGVSVPHHIHIWMKSLTIFLMKILAGYINKFRKFLSLVWKHKFFSCIRHQSEWSKSHMVRLHLLSCYLNMAFHFLIIVDWYPHEDGEMCVWHSKKSTWISFCASHWRYRIYSNKSSHKVSH